MNEFTLKQIGIIKTGKTENGRFLLQIDEPFREGLSGLEGFSYIDVLFWCHFLDDENYREMTVCPKPYQKGPETMGLFATRSPVRPNPIGLSPCPVISVDKKAGIVEVAFIDAEDGTPLLDIKPYHPATDRVRDAKVPEWCRHWPEWYEDNAAFDWEAEFENAK
jgi:tRNA-Thr(GGU) m(6)t(6)A37 methyltransferase TsaA